MNKSIKIAALALLSSTVAVAQTPLTTNNGSPVGDNQNSKTVGNTGPVLLEDIHLIYLEKECFLIEIVSHFYKKGNR